MGIRVSVVVAVHNPGVYIEPLIASLLEQTMARADYEMIFVDDGSTDDTPARWTAWPRRRHRSSSCTSPTAGGRAARQRGRRSSPG